MFSAGYFSITKLYDPMLLASRGGGAQWASGRVGKSACLSIQRSWVRIPPTPFRILGKFVYPMLPKSLGMLLIYIRKGRQ